MRASPCNFCPLFAALFPHTARLLYLKIVARASRDQTNANNAITPKRNKIQNAYTNATKKHTPSRQHSGTPTAPSKRHKFLSEHIHTFLRENQGPSYSLAISQLKKCEHLSCPPRATVGHHKVLYIRPIATTSS